MRGIRAETAIKQAVILEMRANDSSYTDSMVVVHYRNQPYDADTPWPEEAAAARREVT